jgi:hypothetical protein|tara:strand:+ start:512 stop:817 length:306 start_codon:yes stop_codon:yes gene_type:complete
MEPGKKDVASVPVPVYSRNYYPEQSWRRRLPTKQEKWHAKARKAGLRARTYLIPDHLDELMVNEINSPKIDPLCTSKSILVQTALEKFFGLEKPINRRVDS